MVEEEKMYKVSVGDVEGEQYIYRWKEELERFFGEVLFDQNCVS